MERALNIHSPTFDTGAHRHSGLRVTPPSVPERALRVFASPQVWRAGSMRVIVGAQPRALDAFDKDPHYSVLFPLKEQQAQSDSGPQGRTDNGTIQIRRSGAAPDDGNASSTHALQLLVTADYFERHWPSLVPRHGVLKLSGDGALATLARSSVETLWHRRADFLAADLLAGFEATLAMLDQSLRQPRRAYRSKAELHKQVLLFIDRELENVTLDPLLIAQRHGCSLRALQVLFAERGSTVTATIRHKRLERCRAELNDSHADRIGQVALRWGFTDPAHFSKLFKSAFGQSPRIYQKALRRAAGRAGGVPHETQDPMHLTTADCSPKVTGI